METIMASTDQKLQIHVYIEITASYARNKWKLIEHQTKDTDNVLYDLCGHEKSMWRRQKYKRSHRTDNVDDKMPTCKQTTRS